MPFSNCGEELCVNIWRKRYCTVVLQIVTFGRKSAKQTTELQRLAAETVDFVMCDAHSVEEKMMWEQNERKIPVSTVSTVRNWSGSSWLVQSTGAPCVTASTDDGDSTERPPGGSRTKQEFSFEDWSQNQLPAESLQASSWKVFLYKWPLSLQQGKQLLGSFPKYACFFLGPKNNGHSFGSQNSGSTEKKN